MVNGKLLLLLASMLLTLSCQESKGERMEREAREYTEDKCPQRLDANGMFTMDSMVYHNDGTNTITYYNSVDVDSAGLAAFSEKKDDMRSILLQGLVNAPDMRNIRENAVTVKYVYRDIKTHKVLARFTFTPHDYE